jgi:drug/metabolite transporter (DMT)-like permease
MASEKHGWAGVAQVASVAQVAGVAQVAAGAAMISFSAVFVKLAHVGPTMAGFYRVLFGGVVLLAVVWIKGDRVLGGLRDGFLGLGAGFFFTMDLAFWHRSIHLVGPGLATLLANCQVFFLAAYGILFLRERPNWRFFVSVPVAMAGLYLIVGVRWDRLTADYRVGVILGLVAGLCYAGYLISLRRLKSGSSPPSSLASMANVSLFTALLMGLTGWVQQEGFAIPDIQSWGALLGYALICQVLGWVVITAGLLKVDASRVGLILLLQPTLAFLWDVVFFARPTTLPDIAGACLTLGSIYLGSLGHRAS